MGLKKYDVIDILDFNELGSQDEFVKADEAEALEAQLTEATNLLKIVSESAIAIIHKGDDARILKEIRKHLT